MDKLKPIVNSPYWVELVKYLEEVEGKEISSLLNTRDLVEIHRSQGKVEVYRFMLSLKERVNGYGGK